MTPEELGRSIRDYEEKLHSEFQAHLDNYYAQEEQAREEFVEDISHL